MLYPLVVLLQLCSWMILLKKVSVFATCYRKLNFDHFRSCNVPKRMEANGGVQCGLGSISNRHPPGNVCNVVVVFLETRETRRIKNEKEHNNCSPRCWNGSSEMKQTIARPLDDASEMDFDVFLVCVFFFTPHPPVSLHASGDDHGWNFGGKFELLMVVVVVHFPTRSSRVRVCLWRGHCVNTHARSACTHGQEMSACVCVCAGNESTKCAVRAAN